MNAQFKMIGEACVTQYYQAYDAGDIETLRGMYNKDALLTFEDTQLQGKDAIGEKHKPLVGTTRHIVTSVDCQPTFGDNGVLVNVIGQVQNEGQEKPLGFTHLFLIRPFDSTFSIINEVFRLTLHNM